MTNIHSLLPMSAFSPYVSLDLSPCLSDPSWPRARGLPLSVPNNHTLSPHLASVVEDACVICLHKTRTLFLYFYRVLSMSLSHTHTHFFHSLSLSLSRSLSLSLVRDSVTSISIWMFRKVKPQKRMTRYMWTKHLHLERSLDSSQHVLTSYYHLSLVL